MLDDHHEDRTLAAFDDAWADGLITQVLTRLPSGKEADAYVCEGHPSTGHALLVLKRYADHVATGQGRRVYAEGRPILDERIARAVRSKTRTGRRAAQGLWLGNEARAMRTLHAAGADVPEPVAAGDGWLLMEYVGDASGAGVQLRRARPDARQAEAWLERLLWNVELFLDNHLVHADLSPFNVLVHDDRLVVIDLPQAVDARTHPDARALLFRDLRNVCAWFARHGAYASPEPIADELWKRYERGLLGGR